MKDTEKRPIDRIKELQTTHQLLKESHSELLESLQEMVFLFNNENIDQQNAKVKAVLTINKALGL